MYAGIAEGLNYMHTKSILHNDIKADNVVLSDCLPACNDTGMKLWPIIIDFSKACPLSKVKRYTLLPHQRRAFKRQYSQLAPDLIDGKVEQSFLSDVFSFGMLVKKMAKVEGNSKILEDLASKSTTYSCNDRQSLQETVTALQLLL